MIVESGDKTCLHSAVVEGPIICVAIIGFVKDIALLPWWRFDVTGTPNDGQSGLASCGRIHHNDHL